MKRKKKDKFVIDISKSWVTWASIGIGLTMYVLFEPAYSLPLGFVWGNRAKGSKRSRFDVWGSYVLPWARRQGIRKRINKEILSQFDMIVSLSGTKTGGKAFMRATGYTYHKATDSWYLLKESVK